MDENLFILMTLITRTDKFLFFVKIKNEIPGISYGFSSILRPWTKKEQKDAVEFEDLVDRKFHQINLEFR